MQALLKIIRVEQTDNSTLSHLYVFDESLKIWLFECYLLEDAIRKVKIPTATAIPTGVFPLKIRKEGMINLRYEKKYKDWHKGMLEIAELPNFKFVMIHIGNYIKDTEGCPLTGSTYSNNGKSFEVFESEKAYKKLYSKIIDRVLAGGYSVEIINKCNIQSL